MYRSTEDVSPPNITERNSGYYEGNSRLVADTDNYLRRTHTNNNNNNNTNKTDNNSIIKNSISNINNNSNINNSNSSSNSPTTTTATTKTSNVTTTDNRSRARDRLFKNATTALNENKTNYTQEKTKTPWYEIAAAWNATGGAVEANDLLNIYSKQPTVNNSPASTFITATTTTTSPTQVTSTIDKATTTATTTITTLGANLNSPIVSNRTAYTDGNGDDAKPVIAATPSQISPTLHLSKGNKLDRLLRTSTATTTSTLRSGSVSPTMTTNINTNNNNNNNDNSCSTINSNNNNNNNINDSNNSKNNNNNNISNTTGGILNVAAVIAAAAVSSNDNNICKSTIINSSSRSHSLSPSSYSSSHSNSSSHSHACSPVLGATRAVSSSSSSSSSNPVVHSDDNRPLAIRVRNLPARSSDTSLKDGLFHEYKKHGKVTWVKVVGQNSERYALVCFKKPEDVIKALEVSHDKLFFGCKIEVEPYQGYDVEDNEFRPYEAELDEYHPKSTRTLFIGNLEKDITASELRSHFECFGDIIEIDIKKQGLNAYAFCQYSDIISVVKAMRKMDGEHLGTNRIKLGFGKSMPTNCVWLDGVAEKVSETQLESQFSRFGVVSKLVIDRQRNLALIFYEQIQYAQSAVKEMRGSTLRGRKLQLDFASRECQDAFYEKLDKQRQRSSSFGSNGSNSTSNTPPPPPATTVPSTVVVNSISNTLPSTTIATFSSPKSASPFSAPAAVPLVNAVSSPPLNAVSRQAMRALRTARHTIDYDFFETRRLRQLGDEQHGGGIGNVVPMKNVKEDLLQQHLRKFNRPLTPLHNTFTQHGGLRSDSPLLSRLGPVVNTTTVVATGLTGGTTAKIITVSESLEVTVNSGNGRRRCDKSSTNKPLPPTSGDIRNLQKERFHLLEQLEECPSSGDESLVSPRKRFKMDRHHSKSPLSMPQALLPPTAVNNTNNTVNNTNSNNLKSSEHHVHSSAVMSHGHLSLHVPLLHSSQQQVQLQPQQQLMHKSMNSNSESYIDRKNDMRRLFESNTFKYQQQQHYMQLQYQHKQKQMLCRRPSIDIGSIASGNAGNATSVSSANLATILAVRRGSICHTNNTNSNISHQLHLPPPAAHLSATTSTLLACKRRRVATNNHSAHTYNISNNVNTTGGLIGGGLTNVSNTDDYHHHVSRGRGHQLHSHHAHEASGGESADGSRPGTPLCDERPEIAPSEPRKLPPRDRGVHRSQDPMWLPLPKFGIQFFQQHRHSVNNTTSSSHSSLSHNNMTTTSSITTTTVAPSLTTTVTTSVVATRYPNWRQPHSIQQQQAQQKQQQQQQKPETQQQPQNPQPQPQVQQSPPQTLSQQQTPVTSTDGNSCVTNSSTNSIRSRVQSSDSSDSDSNINCDNESSLDQRIRSLDVMYERWSGGTKTGTAVTALKRHDYMSYLYTHRPNSDSSVTLSALSSMSTLSSSVKSSSSSTNTVSVTTTVSSSSVSRTITPLRDMTVKEESDIVKSVLAKRSVFDDDLQRLKKNQWFETPSDSAQITKSVHNVTTTPALPNLQATMTPVVGVATCSTSILSTFPSVNSSSKIGAFLQRINNIAINTTTSNLAQTGSVVSNVTASSTPIASISSPYSTSATSGSTNSASPSHTTTKCLQYPFPSHPPLPTTIAPKATIQPALPSGPEPTINANSSITTTTTTTTTVAATTTTTTITTAATTLTTTTTSIKPKMTAHAMQNILTKSISVPGTQAPKVALLKPVSVPESTNSCSSSASSSISNNLELEIAKPREDEPKLTTPTIKKLDKLQQKHNQHEKKSKQDRKKISASSTPRTLEEDSSDGGINSDKDQLERLEKEKKEKEKHQALLQHQQQEKQQLLQQQKEKERIEREKREKEAKKQLEERLKDDEKEKELRKQKAKEKEEKEREDAAEQDSKLVEEKEKQLQLNRLKSKLESSNKQSNNQLNTNKENPQIEDSIPENKHHSQVKTQRSNNSPSRQTKRRLSGLESSFTPTDTNNMQQNGNNINHQTNHLQQQQQQNSHDEQAKRMRIEGEHKHHHHHHHHHHSSRPHGNKSVVSSSSEDNTVKSLKHVKENPTKLRSKLFHNKTSSNDHHLENNNVEQNKKTEDINCTVTVSTQHQQQHQQQLQVVKTPSTKSREREHLASSGGSSSGHHSRHKSSRNRERKRNSDSVGSTTTANNLTDDGESSNKTSNKHERSRHRSKSRSRSRNTTDRKSSLASEESVAAAVTASAALSVYQQQNSACRQNKNTPSRKILLSSADSDDSDETAAAKKGSIFEVPESDGPYVSMYDKVKARSCKNMQKQEEEKKIKATFSQLKQSRMKREEKKRSASYDGDSDSDFEDRYQRSGGSSSYKSRYQGLSSTDDEADVEDENKLLNISRICSDSDSRHDVVSDRLKLQNNLLRLCDQDDSSEDEIRRHKYQRIRIESDSESQSQTQLQSKNVNLQSPNNVKVKQELSDYKMNIKREMSPMNVKKEEQNCESNTLAKMEIKNEPKDYFAGNGDVFDYDLQLTESESIKDKIKTPELPNFSPEIRKKHKKSKKRQRTQIQPETKTVPEPDVVQGASSQFNVVQNIPGSVFDELKRDTGIPNNVNTDISEKKRHKERKEKKREKLRSLNETLVSSVDVPERLSKVERHRLKKSKKAKSLEMLRLYSTPTSTSATAEMDPLPLPIYSKDDVSKAPATPTYANKRGGEKMEDIFGPISDDDEEEVPMLFQEQSTKEVLSANTTFTSDSTGNISDKNPYKQEPLTPKSHTVEENEENKLKISSSQIDRERHRKEKREKKRKEREKMREQQHQASVKQQEDENSVDLDAAGRALEAQLMDDSDNRLTEEATPSTATTYRSDMTDVFRFSDGDENTAELTLPLTETKSNEEDPIANKSNTQEVKHNNNQKIREKKKKKKRSKEEKEKHHHQRRENLSSTIEKRRETTPIKKLSVEEKVISQLLDDNQKEQVLPLRKSSPGLPSLLDDDDDETDANQAPATPGKDRVKESEENINTLNSRPTTPLKDMNSVSENDSDKTNNISEMEKLQSTNDSTMPDLFINDFERDLDQKLSESAVQSISVEFQSNIMDEPKETVLEPSPDVNKIDDNKSRVIISQEETESAVTALLGESFSNCSNTDYSYELDEVENVETATVIPAEADEEAALAAQSIAPIVEELPTAQEEETVDQDVDEVSQAVQGISRDSSLLDIKIDTPQSDRGLLIDTDTEENIDEADSSGPSLKIDETAEALISPPVSPEPEHTKKNDTEKSETIVQEDNAGCISPFSKEVKKEDTVKEITETEEILNDSIIISEENRNENIINSSTPLTMTTTSVKVSLPVFNATPVKTSITSSIIRPTNTTSIQPPTITIPEHFILPMSSPRSENNTTQSTPQQRSPVIASNFASPPISGNGGSPLLLQQRAIVSPLTLSILSANNKPGETANFITNKNIKGLAQEPELSLTNQQQSPLTVQTMHSHPTIISKVVSLPAVTIQTATTTSSPISTMSDVPSTISSPLSPVLPGKNLYATSQNSPQQHSPVTRQKISKITAHQQQQQQHYMQQQHVLQQQRQQQQHQPIRQHVIPATNHIYQLSPKSAQPSTSPPIKLVPMPQAQVQQLSSLQTNSGSNSNTIINKTLPSHSNLVILRPHNTLQQQGQQPQSGHHTVLQQNPHKIIMQQQIVGIPNDSNQFKQNSISLSPTTTTLSATTTLSTTTAGIVTTPVSTTVTPKTATNQSLDISSDITTSTSNVTPTNTPPLSLVTVLPSTPTLTGNTTITPNNIVTEVASLIKDTTHVTTKIGEGVSVIRTPTPVVGKEVLTTNIGQSMLTEENVIKISPPKDDEIEQDSKEDSDYWSAKELNIETVIKKAQSGATKDDSGECRSPLIEPNRAPNKIVVEISNITSDNSLSRASTTPSPSSTHSIAIASRTGTEIQTDPKISISTLPDTINTEKTLEDNKISVNTVVTDHDTEDETETKEQAKNNTNMINIQIPQQPLVVNTNFEQQSPVIDQRYRPNARGTPGKRGRTPRGGKRQGAGASVGIAMSPQLQTMSSGDPTSPIFEQTTDLSTGSGVQTRQRKPLAVSTPMTRGRKGRPPRNLLAQQQAHQQQQLTQQTNIQNSQQQGQYQQYPPNSKTTLSAMPHVATPAEKKQRNQIATGVVLAGSNDQDVYEFHDDSGGEESRSVTVSTVASGDETRPRFILTIKSPGQPSMIKTNEKLVAQSVDTCCTEPEKEICLSTIQQTEMIPTVSNATEEFSAPSSVATPIVVLPAPVAPVSIPNTRKSRRLQEKDRSTIDDVIEDVVRNTQHGMSRNGGQTPPRRSGRNLQTRKDATNEMSVKSNPIGRPRRSKERNKLMNESDQEKPNNSVEPVVAEKLYNKDAEATEVPQNNTLVVSAIKTNCISQNLPSKTSTLNTTITSIPTTPIMPTMPQHPKKKALAAAEIENYAATHNNLTPPISAIPKSGQPVLHSAAPATQKSTGGAADAVNKALIDPVLSIINKSMQQGKEGSLPSGGAVHKPMDPKKMMQAAVAAAAAAEQQQQQQQQQQQLQLQQQQLSKVVSSTSGSTPIATPITAFTKSVPVEAASAAVITTPIVTATSQQQQQPSQITTPIKQPIVLQQSPIVLHAQHTNLRPTSLKAHVLNSQKHLQQTTTLQHPPSVTITPQAQQLLNQQHITNQQQQQQQHQQNIVVSSASNHIIHPNIVTRPSHQLTSVITPSLPVINTSQNRLQQQNPQQTSIVIKPAQAPVSVAQVLHVVSPKTSIVSSSQLPISSVSQTHISLPQQQQQPQHVAIALSNKPHQNQQQHQSQHISSAYTPNLTNHQQISVMQHQQQQQQQHHHLVKQQLPPGVSIVAHSHTPLNIKQSQAHIIQRQNTPPPSVQQQQSQPISTQHQAKPIVLPSGILAMPHPTVLLQNKSIQQQSAPPQQQQQPIQTNSGITGKPNLTIMHNLQAQGTQMMAVSVASPPTSGTIKQQQQPQQSQQQPPQHQPAHVAANASNLRTTPLPAHSPQNQSRVGPLMLPTGMPVPSYEANMLDIAGYNGGAIIARVAQSPPPAHQQVSPITPNESTYGTALRGGVPRDHYLIYQQILRSQESMREYDEKMMVNNPSIDMRHANNVSRSMGVPHSLQSPQNPDRDSPQVAQIYVHNARMPPHPHYPEVAARGGYYEHSRALNIEPPPAHRPSTIHSVVAPPPVVVPPPGGGSVSPYISTSVAQPPPSTPTNISREREQDREKERHILNSEGMATDLNSSAVQNLRVTSPQLLSNTPGLPITPIPPQADSLHTLLQRYPVMWQGLLALKTDQAAVQMHFVFGNPLVARASLPCNGDGTTPPLRIAQRMRLEQTQLEGVAKKMQFENEHCMLLALPCGRDHADVLQHSRNLQTGFITYLQQKMAAGIVNIPVPGSEQAAYVVHIFPACDFANENLERAAPDLKNRVAEIAHLLIIIATV